MACQVEGKIAECCREVASEIVIPLRIDPVARPRKWRYCGARSEVEREYGRGFEFYVLVSQEYFREYKAATHHQGNGEMFR